MKGEKTQIDLLLKLLQDKNCLGSVSLKTNFTGMVWNYLRSLEDLENLKKESLAQDVLIFKHSTRCNVSADSLAHVESQWDKNSAIKPYFLDLLTFREISDRIENDFQVRHQSPQILLLRKGECIYNESHWRIDVKKIEEK